MQLVRMREMKEYHLSLSMYIWEATRAHADDEGKRGKQISHNEVAICRK